MRRKSKNRSSHGYMVRRELKARRRVERKAEKVRGAGDRERAELRGQTFDSERAQAEATKVLGELEP